MIRISFISSILFLFVVHSASADWTAVRDLVRQGDRLTDEKEQEKTYRRAYTMAQSLLASRPNVSNEHLWLAVAAGRLALVASTKERIQLSKVVKDNAEKAIALDRNNVTAYVTLGFWHFYVADLSWVQKNAAKALYGGLPPASYEKAVEYLSKALQLGGIENPVEVFYIRARAYSELDKDALAQLDYKRCIAGAARNEKERKMQKEAKEELE